MSKLYVFVYDFFYNQQVALCFFAVFFPDWETYLKLGQINFLVFHLFYRFPI